MTGVNKLLGILLLTFILLAQFACTNKNNFSFNEEIDTAGWSKHYKPSFTVNISDTLSAYDISLSVRNTHEYPFRNIFFFITTTSPAGLSIKDTIEYQLADEKGKWYGKGLGDLHNLIVPFKSNILFPQSGNFTFTIEQGMRKEPLPGIADLGIIINQRTK